MSYDEAFESLLFGSGNLIGLTVMVALNVMIMIIPSKAKLLMIPIDLLFVSQYFVRGQNFAWHGIIMLIMCIFLIASALFIKEKK